MEESASKEFVILMCTAGIEKQVRKASQQLSSERFSLIISGLNISIPQFVNGAASVHLSCGKSAIFCDPIFSCNLRHTIHLCRRCQKTSISIQNPFGSLSEII